MSILKISLSFLGLVIVSYTFSLFLNGSVAFSENLPEEGLQALKRGDYNTAMVMFMASEDSVDSLYYLGLMHEKGMGVSQDKKTAMTYFKRAAEQGDNEAITKLGRMHELGDGIPKNYTEARRWYQKAAEKGYANAQYDLGLLYRYGYGVSKNKKKSKKWIELAAKQDHPMALNSIGESFYLGTDGYRKDYLKAWTMFSVAAELGDSRAQSNLGIIYAKGHGPEKNFILAHMWWSLAANQGEASSNNNIRLVEKSMTKKEVEQAKELAETCFLSGYKDCPMGE